MERSDSSIKEILGQVSKDDAKAVVEEVREIILRDLKNSDSNSFAEAKPDDRSNQEGNKNAAQSARAFIHSDTAVLRIETLQQHEQRNKDQAATENEMAFTIEKGSETYKNIHSMVEWYRDSYLIGSEFADRRSAEKKSNTLGYDAKKFAEIRDKIFNNNIRHACLFDKGCTLPKSSELTGMAYPFLTDYAEWYIKTTYARDLLKPTAMWIASKEGPMMTPAIRSLASTIPLMQETADSSMKSNVLWMLQDQEWKDWAKSLTTQYVYRSQKDG